MQRSRWYFLRRHQYWSDVISIIPHEENNIDLQLELLADLTHDPNPDRFDGVPPEYQPEKIMVASLSSIRGLLVQSVVGQTPEEQKIYYFINDHLGTPQKLLDENADVVWSVDYKPFGEADVNVNTFANQFRLPGQYFDSESGLHYNYYRYYDSNIGRYLKADPIGMLGGINLFAHVLNDPINSIDPFGLLVQVGQHPAFINHSSNPYSHTAIILRPDNPIDFSEHPFFQNSGGTMATLSGHARFKGNTLVLISTPNYPGDAPCNLKDFTKLKTPKGMTDTEFIKALIAADRSYNNNTPYNAWPYLGSYEYNSNSFVSGIIEAAGSVPPVLPGIQPGYNQPLPLVIPHRGDNLH